MKRKRTIQLFIALILNLYLAACSSSEKDENLIMEIVNGKNAIVDKVMTDPDRYKLQILYTQIDRDSLNIPSFRSYAYHVDEQKYFYPASTVKMPTAFMALEKLNKLQIAGLDKHSIMLTDSAYSGQYLVHSDSTSESGLPSIDHYIKKIFLVSDNQAFNRLYEFVGQRELNEGLRNKGYKNTRITHRLEIFLSMEENQKTNPIRFYSGDSLVYSQPLVTSEKDFTAKTPIFLGKGFISNEQLIKKPMDFTQKNNISIRDLQNMLKSVLFHEYIESSQRFVLTPDDYQSLYQYMSEYPGESGYPSYDSTFYSSYVKFLMFGNDLKPIPKRFRLFNKVGDAYGFLIDNAYIVDFDNDVEFLLSVVMQVNENQIYNDGIYEYDQIGFPFMASLGELIYTHELSRTKVNAPDLSKFKLKYN